ncbi:GNAT family N-acetyltransferase [Luteimonas sp. SDU82]|uniref:GNAT family N-acetyltransferase n=1 Tax=Luteimonas sp. SDU82 TaxID=3422592 RepID=UPI003EB90214
MDIGHRPGRGFQVEVDGHRAVLDYALDGDRMRITHTGVPAELRGRGIAGHLVRAAFEHARANGLRVLPQCEYAAAWLERHPDYADIAIEG